MTDRKILACSWCESQGVEICEHLDQEISRLWKMAEAYGRLLVASTELRVRAEILVLAVDRLPLFAAIPHIHSAIRSVSGACEDFDNALTWRSRPPSTPTMVRSTCDEPREQPDDLRTVDGEATPKGLSSEQEGHAQDSSPPVEPEKIMP